MENAKCKMQKESIAIGGMAPGGADTRPLIICQVARWSMDAAQAMIPKVVDVAMGSCQGIGRLARW
jgi:hypothetical protein